MGAVPSSFSQEFPDMIESSPVSRVLALVGIALAITLTAAGAVLTTSPRTTELLLGSTAAFYGASGQNL
jgi:hypothetical protein